MVYTTYFGNLKNLPDNMIPIAITRWTPKWYKGLNYNALAPSDTLLRWWIASTKSEENWKKYCNMFNYQLKQLDAQKIYNHLKTISKGKIPVLVCYEKPYDYCHRHLVAEWFNKNGIECKEV